MRFSIRDLLWATLVVAMGLGWWVSYRAIDGRRLEAVGQAHRQRATLDVAKQWYDTFRKPRNPEEIEVMLMLSEIESPIRWTVLDEPLVEP